MEPDQVDLYRGLTPRPTQKRFLESNAAHKAYIGNFGSGKTEALVWQDILLNHLFAPNFTLIGRFRYKDLADTTRKRYMEIAHPSLIKRASIPEKGDGYVDWNIGSTTIFRNLDEPSKFGSLELGAAGIDEAWECPEGVWQFLDGRVGRLFTGERRGKCYAPLYATTNPGGRDYLYKLFCTKKAVSEAEAARAAGLPPEYELFHPRPRENEEALPPDYYRKLQSGKPEWWIRRFINGELGALEGLVFPRFEEAVHVIDAMPIPKHWPRVSGHDHGSRNPTAILWVAVDEEGNVIAYREYEKAGLVPSEHCRNILRIERNEPKPVRRMADPSMFNATIPTPASQKFHSIAEEYNECSILLERGDNAMQASLVRVNQMLWCDPDHNWPAWHKNRGRKGAPRLFFFSDCEHTIERVSAWKFKEYASESMGMREEPEEKDDHLPDCLRYICTSFPEAAPALKEGSRQPTTTEWQKHRVSRLVAYHRRMARARDYADLEMTGEED